MLILYFSSTGSHVRGGNEINISARAEQFPVRTLIYTATEGRHVLSAKYGSIWI